jgi:LacI family transcriptional regulator
MNKKRPTIRDIARETGLSLGTVSQALSNKSNVAEDTRNRVLETAVELGYEIRERIPSTTRTYTVGVLMKHQTGDPLTINPFYSYILAGAERECRKYGMSLMYGSVEVDLYNRPLGWPPVLFNKHVDGMLIIGAFLEDTIKQINHQLDHEAVVLVDAYAPGQPFDSIVTDNINAAIELVNYLIASGHRHIGLIGSQPDSYPSIRERRKGYQRALKQHHIHHFYIEDGPLTLDEGYEATHRLLKRAPQVTAIFACNDNVAMGVMNAARDLGLNIPRDLSLVGFDNIDLSRQVSPALTTVDIDKNYMGVLAVRQLRDLIENPERTRLTILLHAQLIKRESVRILE